MTVEVTKTQECSSVLSLRFIFGTKRASKLVILGQGGEAARCLFSQREEHPMTVLNKQAERCQALCIFNFSFWDNASLCYARVV